MTISHFIAVNVYVCMEPEPEIFAIETWKVLIYSSGHSCKYVVVILYIS